MDPKKIAKRGILIFLAAVAVCMFFGRTVQNLTTPKVRMSYAQQGKLSKFYSLQAQVTFPKTEDIVLDSARTYPLNITRVYVVAGQEVKQGDQLMTAALADFDEKSKSIKDNLTAKNEELAQLDAQNRRAPKETERNKRYRVLIDAMNALSEKRVAAQAQGLSEDAWAREQAAYDKAKSDFYDTYLFGALAVTDDVFNYIEKRDQLLADIADAESQLLQLEKAKAGTVITAPRNGVVTEVKVSAGDSYQGGTPLYIMAAEDSPAVLRALTEIKFAPGTKAKFKDDWQEISTVVSATGFNREGKRYVDFELNDKILESRGGMAGLLAMDSIKITISSRASTTTTLIPSSCLRTEDGGNYVFVAVYEDAGMLGGAYKVKKVSVTVLDKGDKQVSVAEDLGSYQIIDREDRALKEGMRVMEQTT